MNTKKGRPNNVNHVCNGCGREYKSSQNLAVHKADAKKGKVKCFPMLK